MSGVRFVVWTAVLAALLYVCAEIALQVGWRDGVAAVGGTALFVLLIELLNAVRRTRSRMKALPVHPGVLYVSGESPIRSTRTHSPATGSTVIEGGRRPSWMDDTATEETNQ